MAGHSHSSPMRFRKDRVDATRAKAFASLPRMITVARLVKLSDALGDNDDGQSVFCNEAFPESVVRALEAS